MHPKKKKKERKKTMLKNACEEDIYKEKEEKKPQMSLHTTFLPFTLPLSCMIICNDLDPGINCANHPPTLNPLLKTYLPPSQLLLMPGRNLKPMFFPLPPLSCSL